VARVGRVGRVGRVERVGRVGICGYLSRPIQQHGAWETPSTEQCVVSSRAAGVGIIGSTSSSAPKEVLVLGEVRCLAIHDDSGDAVLCIQPAIRETIDLQGKQSWRRLHVWPDMTWRP
jgi:hypothetical protein